MKLTASFVGIVDGAPCYLTDDGLQVWIGRARHYTELPEEGAQITVTLGDDISLKDIDPAEQERKARASEKRALAMLASARRTLGATETAASKSKSKSPRKARLVKPTAETPAE